MFGHIPFLTALTVLCIRMTVSAFIHTLYTQRRQKELPAVSHDVLIAERGFGFQGGEGYHFVKQLLFCGVALGGRLNT